MSNSKLSGRIKIIVDSRYGGNWNDFATAMEISASTQQNIKSGKNVSITTATRIADRLGLSLDWLLAGIGPMYRLKSGLRMVVDANISSEEFLKEQLIVWLETVWPDLTHQQRVWVHEQIRHALPEFNAWLSATPLSPTASPQDS